MNEDMKNQAWSKDFELVSNTKNMIQNIRKKTVEFGLIKINFSFTNDLLAECRDNKCTEIKCLQIINPTTDLYLKHTKSSPNSTVEKLKIKKMGIRHKKGDANSKLTHKRCLTSLTIRRHQNEITTRYHHIPIRIGKTNNSACSQGCGETRSLARV